MLLTRFNVRCNLIPTFPGCCSQGLREFLGWLVNHLECLPRRIDCMESWSYWPGGSNASQRCSTIIEKYRGTICCLTERRHSCTVILGQKISCQLFCTSFSALQYKGTFLYSIISINQSILLAL